MTKDEQAAKIYSDSLIQKAKEAAMVGGSWAVCPTESQRDFLAGITYAREEYERKAFEAGRKIDCKNWYMYDSFNDYKKEVERNETT